MTQNILDHFSPIGHDLATKLFLVCLSRNRKQCSMHELFFLAKESAVKDAPGGLISVNEKNNARHPHVLSNYTD
jgi:hypothetical protein